MRGMNLHFEAPGNPPTMRKPGDKGDKKPARLFSRSNSVLSKAMTEQQESWLLDYADSRWNSLHNGLSFWRNRMARYERLSDDDYTDRTIPNPDVTNATEAIFARQNFTLGMTAGFADFVYAQARDDIFGTRPWLAATPEGPSKIKLADVITKNANWKLNQSNIESVGIDALRAACDLGTQFVKVRWLEDPEEYETLEDCAHSIKTGQPILDPNTNDYIRDVEHIPEGTDPADVEWRELLVQNVQMVYENAEASLLDYRNIAFDDTAPELDLRYTDFFHQFEMGVHDICNHYGLGEDTRRELLLLADESGNDAARDHRGETNATTADPYRFDEGANPKIKLVEGFIRCAPLGNGKTVRVNVIFSPKLSILFECEYLANVTPKGMLPVFPVRCFKVAGRITGKGYFEKYEDANDAVDGQYNNVTYHNRKSSDVLKGFHRNALVDTMEGKDFVMDPDITYEINDGFKITDAFEFLAMPDNDNRSIELLGQMTQMMQMKSGISSAAQGELKGAPQSNTATGVNQIISRGAVLVKVPISQMKTDITGFVSFAVHLHYANHNHDEVFTWGEGQDAELLELKAADAKNLTANVTLTMSQSQSQDKLAAATTGIGIAGQYAMLPETEKASQRRLFIQALSSLGFNDADRVIREAAVTPEAIMALLPPDMQTAFQAFLQTQGAAPQAPGGEMTPAADSVAPVSLATPQPTI